MSTHHTKGYQRIFPRHTTLQRTGEPQYSSSAYTWKTWCPVFIGNYGKVAGFALGNPSLQIWLENHKHQHSKHLSFKPRKTNLKTINQIQAIPHIPHQPFIFDFFSCWTSYSSHGSKQGAAGFLGRRVSLEVFTIEKQGLFGIFARF